MKTEDLIEKYIDGTLSDTELKEFESAVNSSPDVLRRLVSELKVSESLNAMFGSSPELDVLSLINGRELAEDELENYKAAGTGISQHLPSENGKDYNK